MFKKTTLFLAASAALAGSARAAITDSICDYLGALNTCIAISTGATACNAATNCAYFSGAGLCLTSDLADGTMTSFTTAKAQTDTKSVAFKAMFDTCDGYSDQTTCEATASEYCDWDSGSCSLDMGYYETFAQDECAIDTDVASSTIIASSTVAAVAAGLAVAGLA